MALDVLKANLDKLAKVLDPVPVATMLYSDSLITPEAWEEAQVQGPAYGRNLKVLTALGKTVQIDEFTFDTFLMRLSEEQVYISLVEDLKAQLAVAREKKGVKRKRADVVPGGEQPVIRVDVVNDATLLSIARDVGPKWEEMGIALGMDFKVLRNEVACEANRAEHMRALYMLQLCRNRDADAFTYKKIAAALEDCGLKSSARKHCYEAT